MQETICDEKNGWGGPNFTQFCREAINKYVEEMQPVPKQLVTSKSKAFVHTYFFFLFTSSFLLL